MTLENIITQFSLLLQNQDLILRGILFLLLILFLLFTLVFGRQIALLTHVVNQVTFSPVFRLIGYSLTIATLVLLVLVIIV